MTRTVLVLLLMAAACGNITRKGGDDGGLPPDDAPLDAAIDAPPDMPPPPPPTEAREIVNGAGRLTGATFTLEVQVGHGFSQNTASGPTYTIQGNTAVKP